MADTTTRVSVPLDASEVRALVAMARDDCRHPREQLRYLLREAAHQRGFVVELVVPLPAPEPQKQAA